MATEKGLNKRGKGKRNFSLPHAFLAFIMVIGGLIKLPMKPFRKMKFMSITLSFVMVFSLLFDLVVHANQPVNAVMENEQELITNYYLEDQDIYDDLGEGDDWYGIDRDAYESDHEPFNNPYDAPPARMSDAEIALFAEFGADICEYRIGNHTELRAFLMGGIGPNDGHFCLVNDISITTGTGTRTLNAANPLGTVGTQFLTAGRPGVFTGVFDGRNPDTGVIHTITNLRLRATNNINFVGSSSLSQAERNAIFNFNTHANNVHNHELFPGLTASPPETAFPAVEGTVGVGFIQQAGNGAVIRNVNFANAGTTDTTRAYHAAANHARSVGLVVGQTVVYSGGTLPVTIDNVDFTSNRMQMFDNNAGDTTGSWGGMVGRVQNNSTLNIRDISIGNIEIHAGGTVTTRINEGGGVVGSVAGGRLNITTYHKEMNQVDFDTRGMGRGPVSGAPQRANGSGLNSGVTRGGGVVGFVFSGHVNIENMRVTSTRAPIPDPIRVRQQSGGILGGLNVGGTVRLDNVINEANVQVQMAAGENNQNGRVGGLVGRAAGTLHIYNSYNYGSVQHQNNMAMAGGLVGYTGTSSRVVIRGSQNGAPDGQPRPGQDFPGPGANIQGESIPITPGMVMHRHTSADGGGDGTINNNNSAAHMGGIVGRSRGSLIIEDSTNYGHIFKASLTASAGRNTSIGGIVGRINPVDGQVVSLDNVRNEGQVSIGQLQARGTIGGVVGEIRNPSRGSATVTLNDVSNGGRIRGGHEAGGIIGWVRPARVEINNALNTGNIVRQNGNNAGTVAQGAQMAAAGIIARAGGSDLRINNARNEGAITHINAADMVATDAAHGARRAGGIVGFAQGVRLSVMNSSNNGTVRGFENAGGIVGHASGNDATVNFTSNDGEIFASRNGGLASAGGVVGNSSRRNLLILNSSNTGGIRMVGNNNGGDGVGGILGRTIAANARVETSFNSGYVRGRNSAGGIVGGNRGTLHITDVYNIGTVRGGQQNSLRSGNGILGRRRSGAVRINNTWVSANVGGYAIATTQGGAAQQNANGAITGITFNNVFVDGSTFTTGATGTQAANPAHQNNRNGINMVTTELLTSGSLPGFSSDTWRIGFKDVDRTDITTYPYFNWQVNGELEEAFFSFIRADETTPDYGYRWRPVMDLAFGPATLPIEFLFRDCNDPDDHPQYCGENGTYTPVEHSGLRIFNTYEPNAFTPVPENVTNHTLEAIPLETLTTVGDERSIGLINENGIVGFESRSMFGRIIIRGYDPLFGSNPNDYIDHAQFEIVSADADDVNLNDVFRDEDGVDTMRGMGLILFDLDEDEPDKIRRGLSPKEGVNINNPSHPTTDDLENYTVVRITALGYEPAYRIIYTDDLNDLSVGTISVSMERVEFEARVWVPQTSEPDDDEEEGSEDDIMLEPGPPGATSGETPAGARTGFGVLPEYDSGSFLAAYPSIEITRGADNPSPGSVTALSYEEGHTIETGGPGVQGHFEVVNVMWGDRIVGAALHHTTHVIEELRFEHLVNRHVNPDEHESEWIKDLDLYVDYIGVEDELHFRFIELLGYDENGEDVFRILNIDGTTANGLTMPNIELMINNEPQHSFTETHTDPAPVHYARYPWNDPALDESTNTPMAPWNFSGSQASLMGMTNTVVNPGTPTTIRHSNSPHFRVTGLSENTEFEVVDTTGTFAPLADQVVSDYLETIYPLRNENGTLFTFANTNNTVAGSNARDDALAAAFERDSEPYLIRTLFIPLVRIRQEEIRVYERIAPDVYVPIDNAVVNHNGNNLSSLPGYDNRFMMNDEINNLLDISAPGYISEVVNAYSGVEDPLAIPPEQSPLDLLLAESTTGDYIPIVLERNRTFTVTFNYYDGTGDAVTVIVDLGDTVADVMSQAVVDRIGITGDGEGWAFWGWFTDAQLDASGRTRNGRRRPTIGDDSFDLDIVLTQEVFDELGVNNNINLYALWALWGDVNDDDVVNGADANLLQQYVRNPFETTIVRPAGHVTRGTTITGADANRLQQYIRNPFDTILGKP